MENQTPPSTSWIENHIGEHFIVALTGVSSLPENPLNAPSLYDANHTLMSGVTKVGSPSSRPAVAAYLNEDPLLVSGYPYKSLFGQTRSVILTRDYTPALGRALEDLARDDFRYDLLFIDLRTPDVPAYWRMRDASISKVGGARSDSATNDSPETFWTYLSCPAENATYRDPADADLVSTIVKRTVRSREALASQRPASEKELIDFRQYVTDTSYVPRPVSLYIDDANSEPFKDGDLRANIVDLLYQSTYPELHSSANINDKDGASGRLVWDTVLTFETESGYTARNQRLLQSVLGTKLKFTFVEWDPTGTEIVRMWVGVCELTGVSGWRHADGLTAAPGDAKTFQSNWNGEMTYIPGPPPSDLTGSLKADHDKRLREYNESLEAAKAHNQSLVDAE